MKVALLATLLAFGGSLAGFAVTTAGDPPPANVAADPPAASAPTDEIVVRGKDRDCPKAQAVDRT